MKSSNNSRLTGHYRRFSQRCRALNEIGHFDKISYFAASTSYFMVLAAFPFLLLVLSILRYTSLDAGDLAALLEGLVPAALFPAVERLIISTYSHASTAMVSVSAITALWSASRSIYGLIVGLNAIYDTRESRGYFYTRSISVVYMFLFLIVLLLTLVLNVFGQSLLDLFHLSDAPILGFFADLIDIRFLILFLVQTALFTAMYAALPNHRNPPGECLAGAVFASIGWQLFSVVFSSYVGWADIYSNIYGSVYAVALSLLWLYCCMSIIFLGGSLNRVIAHAGHGRKK